MNDLRERFAELRDEERQLVPPFALRVRHRRLRLVPAFAVLVAILIASTFLIRPRETNFTPADREAARSLAAWHPPTDFLMRTPGSDLLESLPDIPSNDLPKGNPR